MLVVIQYLMFLIFFLVVGIGIVTWFSLGAFGLFVVVKGAFIVAYVLCEVFPIKT